VPQLYFNIQKQLDGDQIKTNQHQSRQKIDSVRSKSGRGQMGKLVNVRRVVYDIQDMGYDCRKDNQDKVRHKEKQTGENADDDIERLPKKQVSRW
jgi:hypothetical protein